MKKKWQCFVKNHNLFLRNLSTNEIHQLSTEGTKEQPYTRSFISPDSKKVICLKRFEPSVRQIHIVESAPKKQLQPKLHTLNYTKPGDDVSYESPTLFDLESKKQIPLNDTLYSDAWNNSKWYWEKDSSQFTFLHNKRGHQALRLISIKPDSGEVTTLINDESKTFIHYSDKTYLDQTTDGEIIWMSERSGWNHLYLINSKTGSTISPITQGAWPVKKVLKVDHKLRQIWFTATGIHPKQDLYHIHYCRVNFDGSNLIKMTDRDGTHKINFSSL